MSVWVLQERDEADEDAWAEANNVPYSPYVDPHGFVVVASSENEARQVARDADDGAAGVRWLDATMTSCEIIEDDGKTRVVMGNWPTG